MKKFAMLLLVCTIGVAFVAGCPTGNAPVNNAPAADKDKAPADKDKAPADKDKAPADKDKK
ncbi:MAG: hypothetical protein IT462_02745 [Planctomycetes bacterium]|nr:hypothetical protein [Planctomycetota bacterium]